MNKKAFFFSTELHLKDSNTECDYHRIPELLNQMIDRNATVNGNVRTLDLTRTFEYLHTMLDVYHYGTGYLFARASKQKPTGSVIGRDYETKKPQALLPGSPEKSKGIEVYTYIYINYETCVLQIISALGAPNENIIVDLFEKYSDEYTLKLIAIPNAEGIKKFYGAEEASISLISLELPNPDPVILEYVLGKTGDTVLRETTDNHISVSVNIKSSVSRACLSSDTETSNKIIDIIQKSIEKFGKINLPKASIKGKARNIKTREYSFYEENFYFPVDIPAYRMEGEQRIYYDEAELAQINLYNMQYSYNESLDFILPIIRR